MITEGFLLIYLFIANNQLERDYFICCCYCGDPCKVPVRSS